MTRVLCRLMPACLSALLFAAGGGWADTGAEVVVDVDSAKREMRVLRGDKVLAVFNPVSVGRWGITEEKRHGDGKTPLGDYRIAWMKSSGALRALHRFQLPLARTRQEGFGCGRDQPGGVRCHSRSACRRACPTAEHQARGVHRHSWLGSRRPRNSPRPQLDQGLHRRDQCADEPDYGFAWEGRTS